MITFKFRLQRATIRQRLAFLFKNDMMVNLSTPNITMDKMESLAVHSPNGVESSLAVTCDQNGKLEVLFMPLDGSKKIEIKNKTLVASEQLKEALK